MEAAEHAEHEAHRQAVKQDPELECTGVFGIFDLPCSERAAIQEGVDR
jgi:hypothetical protein